MVLAGHDDMVEQLAPDGFDEPLGNTVLPGRALGRAHRPDAHVLDRGFDASAELSIAIEY